MCSVVLFAGIGCGAAGTNDATAEESGDDASSSAADQGSTADDGLDTGDSDGAEDPPPGVGFACGPWNRSFDETIYSFRGGPSAIQQYGDGLLIVGTNDTDVNDPTQRESAYLKRLDADGVVEWSIEVANDAANIRGWRVAANDTGIYIAGNADGPYSEEAHPMEDLPFVMKFDDDGNQVWARTIGTEASGYTSALALAVDTDGSVYLGGGTEGEVVPGSPTRPRSAYLVKFTAEGETAWTKQFRGNTDWTSIRDIVPNPSGGGIATLVQETGPVRSFLQGYDAAGEPTFKTSLPYAGASGIEIAISPLTEDFIVLSSDDDIDLTTTWLGALSPAGEPLWEEVFDFEGFDFPSTLAVNDDGEIFVAGNIDGFVPGHARNPAVDRNDIFVFKTGPQGEPLWVQQLVHPGDQLVWGVDLTVYNDLLVLVGQTESPLFDGDETIPPNQERAFVMGVCPPE